MLQRAAWYPTPALHLLKWAGCVQSNMQKLEQAGEASPDELAPEDVPEQTAAVVIKEAKAPKVLRVSHAHLQAPLSLLHQG